jgi:hypothetical protein
MKNILLVLISFVIIGCTTVSPITNTVDLTNTDFINAKDFKEAKACEIYLIGFIGPFGNAQIIKAIQENYIKKVYAVDKYFSNWILFQRRCVLVYGEEMTPLEKHERKKKDARIKRKIDAFWDKKKPWYSDLLFWEN